MSNKTGQIYKGQKWVELEGIYTLTELITLVNTIEALNEPTDTLVGGSEGVVEDGI